MPYTRDGLTAGKRDIDARGQTRVVTDQYTLTDYEAGGVDFDPVFEAGVTRTAFVDVNVVDDSAYMARFDYEQNSIRVFDLSDGSEPADSETINLEVRVKVEGYGG